MNKLLILSFSLILSGSSLAAQEASEKIPNFCKPFDQASCTADKACVWKPSETWTREDGKQRVTKARCAYDAKQAKRLIFNQVSSSSQN